MAVVTVGNCNFPDKHISAAQLVGLVRKSQHNCCTIGVCRQP